MKILNVEECSVEISDGLRDAYGKLANNSFSFLLVTTQGSLAGYVTRASIEKMIFAYGFDGHIDPHLVETCHHIRIAGESDNSVALKGRSFGFLPILERGTNQLLGCEYFDRQGLRKVGDVYVGDGVSPFLVAEVGNNHQGDIDVAAEYVTQAISAGFDAVKFQMRDLNHVYKPGYLQKHGDHAVEDEYVNNLISKYSLTPEQILELIQEHSDKCVFATPFDLRSARLLLKSNVKCIKVASADLTFVRLHTVLAESGLPIIISTGAASTPEIDKIVDIYNRYNNLPMLLHCVANYPPSPDLINLNNIKMFKERYGVPIGYSSHDVGQEACTEAVAIGAALIEKHVTFDCSLEGNDHSVSLPIEQWKPFVSKLQSAFSRLGNFDRTINQGEKLTKLALGKSLYAKYDIPEGTLLTLEYFDSKSPAKGLTELDFMAVGQVVLNASLEAGQPLLATCLSSGAAADVPDVVQPIWNYGVPVRFHDVESAIKETKVVGVEYHLSEHDLKRTIHEPVEHLLNGRMRQLTWIAVHCPEQFAGDFVVDFSSQGSELARSEQIVIDTCRFAENLARYSKIEKIPVVVNLGGMTREPLPRAGAEQKALDITRNIKRLLSDQISEFEKVLLMPQTMPPYPWIFGGSRFHNCLITKEQISSFCGATGLKITLDTAHSLMHCIDDEAEFTEFLSSIGGLVGHVHLGDAIDSRSEGLALGEGLLPLQQVCNFIENNDLTCVTEIWSGHLNNFAGFKTALRTVDSLSLTDTP